MSYFIFNFLYFFFGSFNIITTNVAMMNVDSNIIDVNSGITVVEKISIT